MPSMGADMESGTLVEWKKKAGDSLKKGDIIAAVETAKGVVDIEIFEPGILIKILAEVGQEIPVGQVIAVIGTAEEAAQAKAAPEPPKPIEVKEAPKPAVVEAPAPAVATAAAPAAALAAAGGGGRVSPLARKVATELGVDLNTVQGTGPGGAIQRADIERAAQAMKAAPSVAVKVEEVKAPPPAPVAKTPEAAPQPAAEQKRPGTDFASAMRQAIAAAMAKSNRDIPHYYLETRIDMSKALRWLEEENTRRTIKDRLLPIVVMVKAVAKALTEVPELNGFWIDNTHQISEAVHIGFAIALRQGGLITPAIHNTDLKTFDELREGINDLILRTRAGHLKSSELTDSTVTLTSLGDRGVEKVFGVIYPPQVALVGLGKISDQVWVENGMIGIRPVLVATLAGDHRATDGHRGGIFLEVLNRNLQEVDKL
jgi:pyruvate dehydrogenase E2 component (dihydrolipoamide acetyltransferase)